MKSAIVVLLSVLVVVSAFGVYEYTQVSALRGQNAEQSESYATLQSSYLAGVNTSVVVQAFDSHLSHIDDFNATALASDYSPNATMIWYGNTFGLGGTYNGSTNIEFAWRAFLGGATNVATTTNSTSVTRPSNGSIILKTNISYQGHTGITGNFTLTTSETFSYIFQSGRWQIVRESALFGAGSTQYSCPGSPCIP